MLVVVVGYIAKRSKLLMILPIIDLEGCDLGLQIIKSS